MRKTRQDMGQKIRRTVAIAIFAALAYVSVIILKVPVMFLTFDLKDVIITIGGLLYGPLAALLLSVVVPLLEFITISDTGVYGLVMNFLSSTAFSVTAALIYKYKKTLGGALIGIISGVFAMTSVMMIANLLITPYFMRVPTATVAAMIPTVLLPFNLTKAVLNATFTVVLYKPVSRTLRSSRLSGKELSEDTAEQGKKKGFDRRSLLVTLIAIAIMIAALVIMFAVLGGRLSFFDVFKKQ